MVVGVRAGGDLLRAGGVGVLLDRVELSLGVVGQIDPLSGDAVADGDKFTVTGRSGAVTFEFNTTGEVTAGNIAVPIAAGAT